MDRLKKERALLRRAFTIAEKECENAFESSDQQSLVSSFKYYEEKSISLSKVDDAIKDLWLSDENTDEEIIFADFDSAETYKKRFITMKSKYEEYLQTKKDNCSVQSEQTPNARCYNEVDQRRRFVLPKIELRKFDGEVKSWLGFWGQFHKIHDDVNIDTDDKYQYLIQATESGSKARQLVESFPPSGDNYYKAIEQLKNRFARDDMIIDYYVRGLLQLVLSQRCSNILSLRDLYDKLFTNLQALETLNVTTDKYASILFPMVESALPVDILTAWERSFEKKGENQLMGLLEFLKKEVESNERILRAQEGFDSNNYENIINKSSEKEPTAACIVSSLNKDKKEKKCIWCEKISHTSIECYKVAKLSYNERKDIVKKRRGCYICLMIGHNAKMCKNYPKCIICARRHTVVMCPDLLHTKRTGDVVQEAGPSGAMICQRNTTTLLQTALVNIIWAGNTVTVRALFDSGSQNSYIKQDIVKKLGMKPVSKEILGHCLFGGLKTEKSMYNVFEFNIGSLDSSFNLKMKALEQNKISGAIPKINNVHVVNKLKSLNITVHDQGSEPTDVALLFGADVIGLLLTGNIVNIKDSLIAVETKIGWTLQGQVLSTHSCLVLPYLSNISISDIWDMEAIGIKDPVDIENTVQKEMQIMRFFRDTVSVNAEGRYEVYLPWKEGFQGLGNNKEIALRRLYSVTNKLECTGKILLYDKVFKEWLAEGIIEVVDGNDNGHYLPHHAVVKESSATTKIRPVFDASAKDFNGNSLNSFIEKGMNLIDLIPRLLLQFRMNAIGITADIRKAFLMISITPKDRDYLQYFWWKDIKKRELLVYRHKRVVFGITCSPFLLAATLNYHLERAPDNFIDVASQLQNSLYVDNCVISVKNKEECDTFIRTSKKLMLAAKFDLRDWVLGPSIESANISVLGLKWETKEDNLYINVNFSDLNINKNITKRILLSCAQKIFDPIGFTCPVTLLPKMLLQRSWLLKLDWDEILPEDIVKDFLQWYDKIELLNKVRIPRWLCKYNIDECNHVSVHIFSDASKASYAACVYLRTEFKRDVHVQLMLAKARVAPMKEMTIPRLELVAAVIGVRLFQQVKHVFKFECDVYFWTDSSVVLTWIKKEGNWSLFVKNRVKEIRTSTKPNQWHHVAGSLNPADMPSRGCNAEMLLNSCWWEGPAWLKCDMSEWPLSDFSVEPNDNLEVMAIKTKIPDFINRFTYFSKYIKIVRSIAWIYRFIFNCKYVNRRLMNELCYKEVQDAELVLFRLIQKEEFDERFIKEKYNLEIYKDDIGIIRLKTRLILSDEPECFKFPILLPGSNIIVQKLIYHNHCLLLHAGSATVLSNLRERFWITNIRRWVKKVISDCVVCKKLKCKAASAPVAPLPANRMKNCKVFEVTGIDVCGPLFLKSGQKVWVVIFTCAVYRAVHLELIESMSTDSFLMALRRFIARRGRVNTVYTDNGTNFVGANNLMKKLNWDRLQEFSTIQRFEWIFNVPGAPWWGGFWERLIRILKDLLRKMLGKAHLNYVELETLLCDCESTINSRPLTYIADSLENLTPLTPSCFLQNICESNVHDLDEIDHTSINLRFRYVQKLRTDLRNRFRNEYLSCLVLKNQKKFSKEIKVGDVVLVESESKRQFWPLGLIIEIFKGKDNICRSAKIKTDKGVILTRPIQKLYLLEFSNDDAYKLTDFTDSNVNRDEIQKDTSFVVPIKTRSGRIIKYPQRLDI